MIERPAARVGVLFSCGNCRHVQRTPGILTQEQATVAQLNFIEGAVRWHSRAFIAFISIPIIGFIAALFIFLAAGDDGLMKCMPVVYGLAAFIQVFLLACEIRSIECLGYSKGTSFGLFFVFRPAWLIRSITIFFRVQSAFKRLKSNGPRPAVEHVTQPLNVPASGS